MLVVVEEESSVEADEAVSTIGVRSASKEAGEVMWCFLFFLQLEIYSLVDASHYESKVAQHH